jgi:hypothetical protein
VEHFVEKGFVRKRVHTKARRKEISISVAGTLRYYLPDLEERSSPAKTSIINIEVTSFYSITDGLK